jgi:hypothetical protein
MIPPSACVPLAAPGSRRYRVTEIVNGLLYDVTAADGEVIGERVPAWVARVIVACEPRPPLVTTSVTARS